MDLFAFGWIHDLEGQLAKLSELAMDENWQYSNKPDENHSYPILHNYLRYTFQKLFEDDLVYVDDHRACFNTGLVTDNQEEIFALFRPNHIPDKQPWCLQSFCKESNYELNDVTPLPPAAIYFDDPAELLFDTRLDIRVNYDHIINENIDRFPPPFNKPDLTHMLNTTLRGAIELARKRASRNYKTAIPHYYKGRIQLLLPLSLRQPKEADLALVVEKDTSGTFYRASTCLTLDMAYNNARLLARPDIEWLRV